jgi:hypothetical protein
VGRGIVPLQRWQGAQDVVEQCAYSRWSVQCLGLGAAEPAFNDVASAEVLRRLRRCRSAASAEVLRRLRRCRSAA